MKKRITFIIAVLAVIISLILPFIVKSDQDDITSQKILLAIIVLVGIIGIISIILSLILKKRYKGSVYIAYHFADIEFINSLISRLKISGYKCYPEMSDLIRGSKIKDLNLDKQLLNSDLLVVVLSSDAIDSLYLSYIVKFFKKTGKPIQVYASPRVDIIPNYLKPYMVFQLPEKELDALSLIIRLINGLFLGIKIRKIST